jgi:hypothetical protein
VIRNGDAQNATTLGSLMAVLPLFTEHSMESVIAVVSQSCYSVTLTGFDVELCGTQDLLLLQQRFECSICGVREASLAVLSPHPIRN